MTILEKKRRKIFFKRYFKKNWKTHKINIRHKLLQSKFLLAPLTKYSIEGESYGVWEPESWIVLHALKQVLEPYLKFKMDLTYATHLKDYGGLKGGVAKALPRSHCETTSKQSRAKRSGARIDLQNQ